MTRTKMAQIEKYRIALDQSYVRKREERPSSSSVCNEPDIYVNQYIYQELT